MNCRTLSAIMMAILLGAQSVAFAEAECEAEAEAEPAETQFSLTEAAQNPIPIFTGSADFRRPSIAHGVFEQPSSTSFNAFGVGIFVAAGADLASTEHGLSRRGVYESNPMQGNRSVRILTHVAAPAFMYWVTDKLHDKGKTRMALVARIGFSVAYSYVLMHNLRTASALPQ